MTQSNLPHLVFDTNALISAAIIPDSVSRKALLQAVERYQLVHSEETWAEFAEVIARKKFDRYFPDASRIEFMLMMARSSKFLNVSITISDCADPKDNKFLELAMEAESPIIVSGDNHLLDMHPYRGISVLAPAEFLRLAE
ncbi:putative toxin-antitoxin system toxin component, PIN family [Duganella radicis]|uniref:Putative toxin-antitoxin system toxin component, PIN family n=1 Tax=Duganella radicis TaxID=551988 RepID=A0A6L6PLU0_9BURK|nr:putative toxin-antitoxin system toxin component, PIN family [Duganella radicis]MTV39577.1 putative toxin-antitoxin system toxin component, PIN family [Duganella radicis]